MSLGRIADYELLETIGRGGMGVVFKARDSRLDRVVALKILPEELARDAEYRARFLREARAEASLSHTSIATCFDLGEARLEPPDLLRPGSPGPHPDRVLYLTVEYVPGIDLAGLIGDRPLTIARVLDLVIQIADGLESAHQSGVIHRDLKPANIRVTPDGRVKILDFGLSRMLVSKTGPASETPTFTTSEGRVLGTADYMAPEQAHGRADARSDLFSLGVILYQLVTGRLPFTGGSYLAVLYAAANEEPPPLARYARDVPDELERIVGKLLAKNPEQRYQSAHEARTDLVKLREEIGRKRRRRLRAAIRAATAAAALALVVGGGMWAYRHWPRLSTYRTVAVMPFANRTGDPRLDYLGEGIAAGVRGNLVRLAGLDVASLSNAQSLDHPEAGAASIARELGVQAVLEGSMRREDGVIFLDVDLADGRNGFVLWSERYPYAIERALDTENQIMLHAIKRLTGRRPPGRAQASGAASRSPSAYDLYLKAGVFLEDTDDPQAPDKALALIAKALEQDPDFALAWAGRSIALWKIWNRDKTPESVRLAEEASDRAIRLNPELLEARLARAQIYRATSRYGDAIRELEEVLRVNPSWDEAQLHLAASYRDAGDLVKAEAALRHAVAQRPEYWRNCKSLGVVLLRRGDYAGARQAFEQIVRLAPSKNSGYEMLATVDMYEAEYSAAIAEYERLPAPVNSGTLATNVGNAYFFQNRLREARRFYGLALAFEPSNPVHWENMGDLLTREAKPDSAHPYYVKAVQLYEDMLHVDPKNPQLLLKRAVDLSKAGDCSGAAAALARAQASLPATDAQCAHLIAKLNAVCGRRAATLEATRRALALGFSARLIRAEDEFRAFAADPQFNALVSGRR